MYYCCMILQGHLPGQSLCEAWRLIYWFEFQTCEERELNAPSFVGLYGVTFKE